jgi:hypothetical protein
MRQTIYKIALSGVLITGAHASSVAAPALSFTAAVKNAAAPSLITVGCQLTGWDWTGAGIRGGLWPGILSVGGYYNSVSYGYSGARPYYGTRHPYSYSCAYAYPVYYGPGRYAQKRHRHHRVATYMH